MKHEELPSEKNLKKLPRWGRVATIARALGRAMPLIEEMLGKNSKKILESIEFALHQAEDSAANGKLSEHLLWSCNRLTEVARSVALGSDECDEDYTRDAIVAAHLLTTCCINANEELEIETLEAISNVVFNFESFKRRKALSKAADAMVVADFDRLRSLIAKAELKIDSPVPVTVLGEAWIRSKPKGWPSASKITSTRRKFKCPRSNGQALSQLPSEVIQFLEQNPNYVIDSPSLECGRIVLNRPEYLAISEYLFSMRMTDEADQDPNRDVSGNYVLTIIDLVCFCEHYSSTGKLCWFVEYECFGCYDADIGTVYLFRDVSWKRLLARADFYINSPWDEPKKPIVALKGPWERLAFKKSKSALNHRETHSEDEIIAELLKRKVAGTLKEDGFDKVCRHVPLDESAVSAVEKTLSYSLPTLLKSMYCEVANGGFGESYGLIGLVGGARDDTNRDVHRLLRDFQKPEEDDPKWKWPDGLLPAFHLGCAMYLCIDCRSRKGRVVLFEPNNHVDGRSWKNSFVPFSESLRKMMSDWLDGKDLWEIAGIQV